MNARKVERTLLFCCCVYVLTVVFQALLLVRADLIVSRMP